MTVQIEIVCQEHNRALTPSKVKQPFGKVWAIFNIDVTCESGNDSCKANWKVIHPTFE